MYKLVFYRVQTLDCYGTFYHSGTKYYSFDYKSRSCRKETAWCSEFFS